MRTKLALNFLPQKRCVCIFATKMAYSLSLVSNAMDNSFILSIFIGVFFDRKLNFTPHVNNIKYNCRNVYYNCCALYPARIGVVTGNLTEDIPVTHQIQTGVWLYCIWVDETIVLDSAGQPRFEIMLQVDSGQPSLQNCRLKLSLQYYIKLIVNPDNPAYSCVVNPVFQKLFRSKPSAISKK